MKIASIDIGTNAIKSKVFETTPTTFVVSSNLETYEYHQFIRRYQDLKKGEGQTIKVRVP